MNDITPRRPNPNRQQQRPSRPMASPQTPPPQQPKRSTLPDHDLPLDSPRQSAAGLQLDVKKGKKTRRRWPWVTLIILIILVGAAYGYARVWWHQNLAAVDPNSKQHVRVKIPLGYGPDQIASELKDADVIRSKMAFSYYLQFQNVAGKLQAGTYNFTKNQSTPEIVGALTNGKTDTVSVTFLPGATLAENKAALEKLGYSKTSINKAFDTDYKNAVLAGKPVSNDFEGYFWGETYKFTSDATPRQILGESFTEFDQIIKKYDLKTAFKKQGLSLYEGITLASIIQREVQTDNDMKQVAQVFYSRLKKDIPLGSDVTYQYAAKKMGVAPTPELKSPYNTRIHKGLPPGPISTPGLSALLAVAHPAKGNYLYFLSGDDDKTYFSRTEKQHNDNIEKPLPKEVLDVLTHFKNILTLFASIGIMTISTLRDTRVFQRIIIVWTCEKPMTAYAPTISVDTGKPKYTYASNII